MDSTLLSASAPNLSTEDPSLSFVLESCQSQFSEAAVQSNFNLPCAFRVILHLYFHLSFFKLLISKILKGNILSMAVENYLLLLEFSLNAPYNIVLRC